MSLQTCREEYIKALKMGQREADELVSAGKDPNPQVLDELLPDIDTLTVTEVGIMDIPTERIVGTKSAGRIAAFSPSFLPLLDPKTEFAGKWISLCDAHLGTEGIRDPITCYEYLGNFYVQEGNKRVSVLRYFGAPRIPASVKRVMPPMSDDPRIVAYYEFVDFFKSAGIYTVQFRRPKDYAKLLALLGKEPGVKWTEDERRTFNARYQYFREAFNAANTRQLDILPEEALLLWLKLYPFEDLSNLSTAALKKSVSDLWADIVASNNDSVNVATKLEASKPGLLGWITLPDHLNVAFIHALTPATSGWGLGHDKGREYMQKTLKEKVTVRNYLQGNTPEEAEKLIEQAVKDGAQVVFATVPQMAQAVLKAAVKYPKVYFFCCTLDQPYSSFRTYYGRVFEAKFITGAIAGAMAQNNRIGYIASYPIYGVPASINAFALGAQLTNPRAQIELRWSCVEGTHQADLFADGIRVISNRDVPVQSSTFLNFCNYGTYLMDDKGELIPLGSPVWVWGKFYVDVIQGILSGRLKRDKEGAGRNYWLGMDTDTISIDFSDKLPQGLRTLAEILHDGMRAGAISPFRRRIVAQDGTVKNNDDTTTFTTEELIHMDWLVDNVCGSIPSFDELLPMSRNMVRELGIYKDEIPLQKEVKAVENPVHLR